MLGMTCVHLRCNDGQLVIMGISKNGYATPPGENTLFRVNSGANGSTVFGSGMTSIYFNGTSDYASFTVYSAAASPSVVTAKLYGDKLGVTYDEHPVWAKAICGFGSSLGTPQVDPGKAIQPPVGLRAARLESGLFTPVYNGGNVFRQDNAGCRYESVLLIDASVPDTSCIGRITNMVIPRGRIHCSAEMDTAGSRNR